MADKTHAVVACQKWYFLFRCKPETTRFTNQKDVTAARTIHAHTWRRDARDVTFVWWIRTLSGKIVCRKNQSWSIFGACKLKNMNMNDDQANALHVGPACASGYVKAISSSKPPKEFLITLHFDFPLLMRICN